MITIILLSLLGLGLAIWTERKSQCKRNPYGYVMSLLIGVILGALIGMGVGKIIPMQTTEVRYSYPIQNLEDNTGNDGSITFGFGEISEDLFFSFYYFDGECYKLQKLWAYNVGILYTLGAPYWESYQVIPTNSFRNLFSTQCIKNFEQTSILYVPEGSLQH